LSQSFLREHRLLNAADFSRVFKEPIKSSDAFFTVLARPCLAESALSRLGLAIAKKQLKRAVDRNRIKRLIREYFRTNVLSDPAFDYVVLTRAAVRNQTNEVLMLSLEKNFSRILKKHARHET